MIKEAIILAGGLGTRLRTVITDMPKCMAPISGKPFLYYLIQNLKESGITHFVFSVGYLHEIIEDYLQEEFSDLSYQISLENEPLGTGGAIKLACTKTSQKNVFICNGDTMYKIDCKKVSEFHLQTGAHCTLSLKPMVNFDRYGVVELNEDHSIKSFKEKQFYSSGLINGGMYALNTESFLNISFPEKFSFEKEYLEKDIDSKSKIYGIIQDAYFIDIGIPEDYKKAQIDLVQ